ncbi:tRNA (cytosine-5-)-methyltransferase [Schizosaccharomyces osmophilus]|uniref:tRNA (Cytosine-5-)-methyltransferase n=1 Tax=Schizosaccharomyces osmophilus TaxID=2545709 RepID=A0AAF0ATP6_9SCHI|nr:tRNA (cytosine-5-)-methyltransferase [Schizosaccharomyces osmophilus]WBW70623.1 tRNA (cytosine-5-)-methyltransferase [Schizosaccharomyces osmophilus]
MGKKSNKPTQGKRAYNDKREIVLENEKFESYYRKQNIFGNNAESENEFQTLMEFLKKPLPTTFRICGYLQHAFELKNHFEKHYIPQLQNVEFEGTAIPAPEIIPWYPNQLAYSIDAKKEIIRKSPPFKRLQRFLVSENEAGNINRQEAVSMLPPLFLDLLPHHLVLDMCAAPGSKTAQLIEAIYNQAHVKDAVKDSANLSSLQGLIIANDADPKRAQMLVHQINRLNSPNVLVVNHDASTMPNVIIPSSSSDEANEKEILKYDRVLADVPCSGDGTFRKNISLWKDWSATSGLSLHPLQLRILIRGLQLLKVGGYMVYSTCSMNPIENEAVVCAALKATGESVSLVDISEKLPELKRESGLSNWKVMDDTLQEYSSPEDSHPENVTLASTMWPLSMDEMKKQHIERCARIYPQHQNTGGFFIAMLKKESPLQAHRVDALKKQDERPELKRQKLDNEASVSTSAPQPVTKTGNNYFDEEPFVYIKPDDESISSVSNFYGLDPKFPRDHFFVRNQSGTPTRSVYFACSLFKKIIENNINRVKFVHGGVRFFVKQDISPLLKSNESLEVNKDICNFRIHSDGVNIISPYLDEKFFCDADLEDLKILMKYDYPRLEQFPENGKLKVGSEKMVFGCNIVRAHAKTEDGSLTDMRILLPVWRSPNSCNLMLARKEKQNLELELFGMD